MKAIANTFIKGFIFVLPLFITFSLIYWVFATAEDWLKQPLEFLLPEGWYVTGMGVASAAAIIFCVGILVQTYVTKIILGFFEHLVESIPFVKTIYNAARDLLYFFAGDKKDEMSKVVLVEVMEGVKLMGFVTNENVTFTDSQDPVYAVYFPMSYQVGGYTAYTPSSRCESVNIDVKTAMQQVLTANVKRKTPHK